MLIFNSTKTSVSFGFKNSHLSFLSGIQAETYFAVGLNLSNSQLELKNEIKEKVVFSLFSNRWPLKKYLIPKRYLSLEKGKTV